MSKDFNLSYISPIKDDDTDKPKVKIKKKDSYYSYEKMEKDADSIEEYLNILERFAIITNLTPERYKKAVKKCRKLVKLLREGKGEKVYDRERYDEYINRLNNE